jgi:hypothetical protein
VYAGESKPSDHVCVFTAVAKWWTVGLYVQIPQTDPRQDSREGLWKNRTTDVRWLRGPRASLDRRQRLPRDLLGF